MSKQIAVSGTADEWQVLINLINAAVKSVGLDGAKAGVVWAERIANTVNNDSKSPKQVEAPAFDTGAEKNNG